MCGSRKYPYPPQGGSQNFLGVGGSKRDKFPKWRGVHKEFFFLEGLKCDGINTYVFFQLIQVTEKNEKFYPGNRLGFLVIYFLSLFWRQTTPRHTSEQHMTSSQTHNGRLEKFYSQSPNIGYIE